MGQITEELKQDIYGINAKKVNSEPGDGHQDGERCVIIAETADTPYGIVYLAIFEDFPLPVGVADFRIKLLVNEKRKKIKLNKKQRDYLTNFPEGMFKFYYDEPEEKQPETAENQEKS